MKTQLVATAVLVAWVCAGVAAADDGLKARAQTVLADKDLALAEQGQRLALYADSLRTMDVELASRCLEVAGIAAFRTGQLDTAVARWQRGVNRARAGEAVRSESSLLNALAIGHTASGDVEAALPVYERALAVRESLADTLGLSRTWGNVAQAYANIGRVDEALAATGEEEKWLKLVDNPPGQVANAIRRAQILTTLRRVDEALLQSERAVELAAAFGDDNVQGMAGMARGNALLDLGRYAEALPVLAAARRQLLASEDAYSAAFAEQSSISCLLPLGRPEEALSRVRTLLSEVDPEAMPHLVTVLRRYEGHALFDLGRVDQAEQMLVTAREMFEARRDELTDTRSRAGIFHASGEIYAALARCQLAGDRVEEAFLTVERGRAAGFRDRAGGGVATIAALQAALAAQGSALVLFNDPAYDPLVAFVLDGTGLRVVEIGPVPPLATDARAALRMLAAGESLATCGPALARLEVALVQPVLAVVGPQVARFAVVPPSFLAGFPLGVLQDTEGRPWDGVRPVSYLPNASSFLDLAERAAPTSGVLALADPAVPPSLGGRLPVATARSASGVPLPEARAEIAVVTRQAVERRVGKSATGAALRAAMQRPLAVLHLATHAVVDPVDGGRSAVVLAGAKAGDNVDAVTAQEIADFDFAGDLVVLSGCSTFGEQRILGEGWFGLPRSFLAAGARSVVSTLWDVDDRGARIFVTAFYDALREGAARDEALVKARGVCQAEGLPPREWAAFVLTGVGDDGVEVLATAPTRRGGMMGLLLALGAVVALGLAWRVRR